MVAAGAPHLQLWRMHDAAWAIVALSNNVAGALLYHKQHSPNVGVGWLTAVVRGPQILAFHWACVGLAVLQLAWVGCLPSSYSLRRRTAFMVLQRAVRLASVRASCEDALLLASVPAAMMIAAEGMAPVPAAIKVCFSPLRVRLAGVGCVPLPRVGLVGHQGQCHCRSAL